MNSSTKERNLIGILAVLVAGAIIFFWFRPTVARYATTRLALATREAEVNLLTERKKRLSSLASQVAAKQSDLDRLFVAVPTTEAQIPEIIAAIVAMTSESGVELVSLQPGAGQSKGTVSSQTTVTVSVRGGFAEIIALTERLERNLRPATIRSATLAGAGSEGDLGRLAATFQISFARAVTVGSNGGGQ